MLRDSCISKAFLLWLPLKLCLLSVLLNSAGCSGDRVQSSLHPAGPAAQTIANLWWVLLTVLGLYTLVVFILTGLAIFRRPNSRDEEVPGRHEGRRFILIGGAILPTIILAPTLVYTVYSTGKLRMQAAELTIRVVGHRWWWEVEYPDHGVVIANELVIPVGEPVEIQLESADVIHSFWVPQLHGKMDMVPGKKNIFWIQADRPGIYRGQCAEYCGVQHALMAFVVKAVEPEQFVQWLQATGPPTSTPPTPLADSPDGLQLLVKHGCGACHTVANSVARGWAGPDLTHLSTRHTLAAGTVTNNRENLLHWLKDPQSIKPGANMPATVASDHELELITDYLLALNQNSRSNNQQLDNQQTNTPHVNATVPAADRRAP